MADKESDTSDHQRFDEMFAHLTPQGANVPYTVTYDQKGNIWVASKGGLFKFDGKTKQVLFTRKNIFPNKMAAFCQVWCYDDTIIYTNAEAKDRVTEFVFLDLNGREMHQQILDGLVQSLVVTGKGEIYLTKQMQGEQSIVWWATMDTPLGWEELLSSDQFAFQTLAVVDDRTLLVATVQLPSNMYSKQSLRLIDINAARIKRSFSEAGKDGGKIHFPRAIKRFGDFMIVLDKTGRFQRFTPQGEYIDTIAEVDAYLANGFVIRQKREGEAHDVAMVTCSGVVRDRTNQAICDDWLEEVPLDGSSWREKRRAARIAAGDV